MGFDGTLKFDTAIDKTGFKLGLDSLGSLAKKGMAIVTGAVGAASAATAALGGYAVSVGKNFESSMAQVIATMGKTKSSIDEDGINIYERLEQAASAAGTSTVFSASEAADALNYLALAGYSAEKASDALPAVLDLAAAGGLDLAYASDLATDAMAALGIAANSENLTHFGDEMAKTASKANTSVAQLGEAILTVGGTAKDLAGGTTELNTALGVLANAGIKGSEGGTALRNIMLAMTPTTDKATEAFERLNLESYDVNGNLRPLNETFKDLNKAISGMTSKEKTNVLNDIFNKVDLKSASAMLAACASSTEELGNAFLYAGVPAENLNIFLEGFQNGMYDAMSETEFLTSIMNDFGVSADSAEAIYSAFVTQLNGVSFENLYNEISACDGAMAQMRDTMNDTLEGDLKSLSSKAEAFGNAIYKNLNEPLRNAASLGIGYIEQLTAAFNEGGFNGLAESFGGVAADAVSTLAGYVPDFADVAVSLLQSLIGGLTENAPKIAEGGIAAVKSLALGILSSAESLIELGVVMIREILSGIADALPDVLEAAVSLFFTLTDGIMELLPELCPIATKILQTFVTALTDNLPLIIPQIFALAYGILDALTGSEFISTIIGAALPIITALADGLFAAAPIVYDMLPKIVGNIFDVLSTVAPEFGRAGLELMKHLAKGINELSPQMIAAMGEIVIAIVDGLKDYFPEVWKAAKEVLGELWEIVSGIAGEILESVGGYLIGAQENFNEWLGGLIAAVVGWAGDIVEKAKEAASDFVTGAMTFLGELPGKLGEMLGKALGAVAKWAVEVTQKAKETASEFIENVREFIQNLPSMAKEHLDSMISNVREWASEITLKAKNTAKEFLENIKEFISKLPSTAKEHLDKTISKVKDWADDLKNKGKKAADDLVEKITSTISSLPDKMAESGRNLVQGLWNGITGAGDWLKSKISEFGGGIIDGFKESFGIHSPSTVMRDQVGKYLAEGIGVGFTENMPDLAAAAQRTADKLGSLDIPDISQILQLTVSDIDIPDIELPKLEMEAPEIDVDLPNLTIDFPDIDLPDFPDDDRKPRIPKIESSAYQALDGGILSANSSIAPQPTSAIFNNYSYSTTTNNNSSEYPPVQPMTINVKLDLNGEDFADGFVDIAADKIDERQGVTVELKKRGLAR